MKPTLSRILLPTDFSPSSDAALEYATMLGERLGASVHVLHVIEGPDVAGGWGSEVFISELPRLREAAQQGRRTATPCDCHGKRARPPQGVD